MNMSKMGGKIICTIWPDCHHLHLCICQTFTCKHAFPGTRTQDHDVACAMIYFHQWRARRKVFFSVFFHNVEGKMTKNSLNVPSIHLEHIPHLLTRSQRNRLKSDTWFAENPFCHSTVESKLFLTELLYDFRRPGIQNMRHMDVYYCTFMVLFCHFLSLTAPMHIMEKCTCICVPRLVNDDRILVFGRTIAFLLIRSVKQRHARVQAKVSAITHEPLKIFPVSTPHVFPALHAGSWGHRRLYIG